MEKEQLYTLNKNNKLHGRYITWGDIALISELLNNNNQLSEIGQSVLGKPIYQYQIGTGNKKVLLWSQMHGNESTTTKALIDFIQLLNSGTTLANYLLCNFKFCCIPILNPDGAAAYTRENANKIDLNRDFQKFSQPESSILMKVFKNFAPHYCYNMHDQRTIYGIDTLKKPATVSFLAPAFNENRDFNQNRIEACRIINAMNASLQQYIPNQIGRFDDTFNNNCAGDSFQEMGVPTILFEAGHYHNDYERESTRKYIFIALLSSFEAILLSKVEEAIIQNYLNIPKNSIIFYDYLYKNVKIFADSSNKIINFAAQITEELVDNQLQLNAYISSVDCSDKFCGHFEFDANQQTFNKNNCTMPILGANADFKIGNLEIINGKIINYE